MFEARIQHGSLLRKIFDSVKEMVVDVNLDCSDGGISIQAMDGSHVSLVMVTLREPFFERYRCDRARTLGLNLSAVCKVFKLCGPDDSVILRHNDDGDALTFIFEGAGEDRMSDFDLKLMNIESEHLGVPDTKFDSVIEMPSKVYSRICSDLSQFSDSVSIQVSNKDIKFACKGELGGGSTILKPRDTEGERIQLTVAKPTTLSFAVRYLNHFAKSSTLCNQMKIALSVGAPLEVTFTIQDDDKLGNVKFFLAPKMDDDQLDGS